MCRSAEGENDSLNARWDGHAPKSGVFSRRTPRPNATDASLPYLHRRSADPWRSRKPPCCLGIRKRNVLTNTPGLLLR